LFRTAAGIAAAAARDWGRAEEHFQIAMHQSDSSAYRTAQPIARFWYASMLGSRGQAGDHRRALDLLNEALSICETVGMPLHARRTQQNISILR
jgi:hypothetical protein